MPNLKIQTNMKPRKAVYWGFQPQFSATPAYGSNLKFIGNVDKTNMYLFEAIQVFTETFISQISWGELNTTWEHKLGTTGIGFELARVSIQSNNLGEHTRTLVHGYLEYRFENNRWDITPGLSVSHYSDQDTFFYPGIDFGFQISGNSRLFFNSGYTYRIPTYTDLYYSDSSTLGNEFLLPEKALSTESRTSTPPKQLETIADSFSA